MQKSISFIVLLLASASCIRTPDTEVFYLSEINYPELRGTINPLDPDMREQYWVNLIDLGDREDFNAGHLPFAENLELDFFIDTNGYIVNGGKAITQRYDDRWEFIIYSSSNDTIAYWAAKSIAQLGYSRVRFYKGGPEDWQGTHGDFLLMNEAGFTDWYDANFPFGDSLEVLVDVHPPSWFSGEEQLAGHLPGAENIPAASLVDTVDGVFTLKDGGMALTGRIPWRQARIVVYDSQGAEEMSKAFLAAAMELGYNNVYLFPGGYETWLECGRELAR
ncbi:MAG: rhodanese-like domain-containing protein [Bacteroidales bacterium]|nr:rhodanese-like domain-containing protein [Bacteroidales bacterium]